MDSQGAGFAFDTANMDFGTVFAAQQAFSKPEDNTSGFFFGDEAIDTTTGFPFEPMSPALLSTPQMSFDMQQPLVGTLLHDVDMVAPILTHSPQTMGNTSGSASDWNQHLTPHMQSAMTTFPTTPTHSYGSMFQQNTTLGKRSRDSQDFPHAKRLHETAHDFTLFPSLDTTSSWTVDTQPTPTSSTDLALPDDAAEVCAMWFNKYNVLPSDKHIESLSQLTGESTEAIRSWFGRLLKQGMGGSQGDSAYKSQTGLIPQQDSFWDSHYSNETLQASPIDLFAQPSEVTTASQPLCSHEHTSAVLPATALRGSKKRCSPTDDQQLLARDPNKIYQCTRKCGKRYGRKCDWKRNEEEGYPCKSWVCSLCKSDGVENVKPCFRKYHFVQHFRNIHPDLNADDFEEASVVSSDTEFPRQCGFCRHRFTSRQDRIDHIADHFKQGKCMLEWNEEEVSDSEGSDDNNDDDNSGDGGSDGGKPSYPPPPSVPKDGTGPKYYGNGGSGSGSGSKPSQSGFFQFELSQLRHGDDIVRQSIIDQHIECTDESIQQQTQSSHQIDKQDLRRHEPSSSAQDDQGVVAGNVVSRLNNVNKVQRLQATLPDEAVHHDLQRAASDTGVVKSISPTIRSDSGEDAVAGIIPQQLLDAQVEHKPKSTLSQAVVPVVETPAKSPRGAVQDSSQITKIDSTEARRPIQQQLLHTFATTPQSFLSIKLLGAGGFSTVDEVIHRDTNLRVGRKTLKNRDQTAAEELRKEVSVLQKLRHPHIIRFLGAYAKGDKMSILLSPVAETTLALWLEQSAVQKSINLTETITSMFGCLVSSVRYLHEQRPIVKHLDIKPQNILIVENGKESPHVILTDFGVSTSGDSFHERPVPITRQYVAPEAFAGLARKESADIWSLGCVFAEMACFCFNQSNTRWIAFRKPFTGKQGKNYWQDIMGVQDGLKNCLDTADTAHEQKVIQTIMAMLNAEPVERPTAADLTLIFTPAPCCLNWSYDQFTFPGPHEELDRVEMCGHQDMANSHVQSHTRGHKDEDLVNPGRILISWLHECLNHHEACHDAVAASEATFAPTRLLEIQPNESSGTVLRLVDSSEIESTDRSIQYVALSHNWGHGKAVLTKETLAWMRTGISSQVLSETIIEAVRVTQSLGYRYVWADTLCVVQDSADDRKQECSTMASVFRNAVITITLDQTATDTRKYSTASTGAMHDRYAEEVAFATSHSWCTALPPPDFNTPGFGWNTRAWVLQESLLSRRFLHLGEQMYWECNSLKASETFPHGLTPLVWEKVHNKNAGEAKTSISRFCSVKLDILGDHPTQSTRSCPSSRLRDCQWIKKKDNGSGDNMAATRSLSQSEDTKTSCTNSQCGSKKQARQTHFAGNTGSTATSHNDMVDQTPRDSPVVSVATSSSSSASSSSMHLVEKSGRKKICSSGQLDQHGVASAEKNVKQDREGFHGIVMKGLQ